MSNDKKILDVCCGGRMFWFNKQNILADYMDIRKENHILCDGREVIVSPEIIGDFRKIPFQDGTYKVVVFDPPHMRTLGENSWMAKKYGKLSENWEDDIKKGFSECFRVLADDGKLIFKC